MDIDNIMRNSVQNKILSNLIDNTYFEIAYRSPNSYDDKINIRNQVSKNLINSLSLAIFAAITIFLLRNHFC